jgi:hypothetical protein
VTAILPMVYKPVTSDIAFQPSASLSVGQLVCIVRGNKPTANGTPPVGPALAVGRMAVTSRLAKGGTKGKALTLLHASKDRLWEMGGETKPPRPRLPQGTLNREKGIKGGATSAQPKISRNGVPPKELSREGAHSQTVNEDCR